MRKAGITPVLGVDIWKPAVENYRRNFPKADVIEADIWDGKFQRWVISKYGGEVEGVTGGPPW